VVNGWTYRFSLVPSVVPVFLSGRVQESVSHLFALDLWCCELVPGGGEAFFERFELAAQARENTLQVFVLPFRPAGRFHLAESGFAVLFEQIVEERLESVHKPFQVLQPCFPRALDKGGDQLVFQIVREKLAAARTDPLLFH